jgi:hypothetical protein
MNYYTRQIDSHLLEWKNDPDHKPLLLRGARQVGKSTAIRNLGSTFRYFVEVNFESERDVQTFFQGSTKASEIADMLSIYFKTEIIPGETLLFFDEIQACPEAIHSLWFFCEQMRPLHVIAAGSLLEFALKDMPSFGVGRISSLFIYPMSFDEFLSATGNAKLLELKSKCNADQPLPDTFHKKLAEMFKTFILVGGMPAAVNEYVKTGKIAGCSRIIADIVQTYNDDFAKYSKLAPPTLLRQVLLSAASQLGGKFVFNKVDGLDRTENVKLALQLLVDAGLLIPTTHTAAHGIPLGAEVNHKFVKYLMLDSAIALAMLGIDDASASNVKDILIANNIDLVDKGSMTEMVAGLEILKYMNPRTRHSLYYWQNLAKGTQSEIDYIIAKNGQIVPLEVKSGVKGSMASLHYFIRQRADSHSLGNPIRCSLENFGKITGGDRDIYIVPLFAMSNIFQAE